MKLSYDGRCRYKITSNLQSRRAASRLKNDLGLGKNWQITTINNGQSTHDNVRVYFVIQSTNSVSKSELATLRRFTHHRRVEKRLPKPEKFRGYNELQEKLVNLNKKRGGKLFKIVASKVRLFQQALRKARLEADRVPRLERPMWQVSHPVPVADCVEMGKDKWAADLANSQKLDPNSHWLFDNHFFTFAPNGTVVVAKKLTQGIRDHFSFDGRKIRRKQLTKAEDFYMAQHRAKAVSL